MHRPALRAALVAIPVYVAACAVPDGGLFRAARFRDVHVYQGYAERLLHGALPYRDVFVEYPPGAFAVFMPPTALGAAHYNAAFKSLMALCGVATLILLALILAELRASTTRLRIAVGLFALSPIALGPISLNTYDAWPALLTMLALWLFLRGRLLPAFGVLGLAVSAKVYPLVLVPLALWFAWRRAGARRAGVGLGVLVLVAAAVIAPFAAYAPHGVYESFHAQATRGLQIESLGASVLLVLDRLGLYHARVVETFGVAGRNLSGDSADAVAAALLALEALAVVAVWWLYARTQESRARLPLAFAAAVAGFLAFTKVFSPQYLVWLLPLVLAGGGAVATALLAIALVLAQVWFFHYHALFRLEWPVWLLLVRNLAMVALYGVLAAELARWKIRIPSRSKTSRHSGLRRSQESWTAVGNG
ncbi:MAG TPA: glycosyltransferase 87 family protein, partial [Gaiellaceae bacterium]|nr:glycosyltransferase 87 family protein [Gaiellaceae bacterium]